MRRLVVLATTLIFGGVLLLSACTTEEDAEEPTATGTPAATAAATKTPTPAGAVASSTPRHLVRRPNLPTPTPAATTTPATAAPVQTVAPQPTVVAQPTVVPPTAPPPTVVVTVVPTPVPTPTPPPTVTPTPAPTPTGPIVFTGQVVDGPWKEEPVFGPCDWWWWVVSVQVEEVIKMEQADGGCEFYSYAPGETIDVLYFANDAPAVAPGRRVEVSGEESMFSCGCTCCCDGCGLLVRVEIAGSYIRSL
jgi:hypothetical protein